MNLRWVLLSRILTFSSWKGLVQNVHTWYLVPNTKMFTKLIVSYITPFPFKYLFGYSLGISQICWAQTEMQCRSKLGPEFWSWGELAWLNHSESLSRLSRCLPSEVSAGHPSDSLGGTQSIPSAYKWMANQSFGKSYPEEIPQAVLNALFCCWQKIRCEKRSSSWICAWISQNSVSITKASWWSLHEPVNGRALEHL